MGILEQIGSVSMIIGGGLIVLAIIALVWMYLWFKKTKEYNMILKSIDGKVDACNTEELKAELKNLSQKEDYANDKSHQGDLKNEDEQEDKLNESEDTQEKENAPKVKHNFKRAMAAIETLEKDEIEQAKALDDKIQATKAEAEKVQAEILKAAEIRATASKRETQKDEDIKDKDIEVKKEKDTEIGEISVNWDEPISKEKANYQDILPDEDEDDDEDECEIDVFDEIRKMLVETEKTPSSEISIKNEKLEIGNVAKSGKEYTREELEDLIKF